MATRKFLYVDANGDYIESAGAFEAADHVASSAGAGDAGKPIVLDAGGKLDASFIDQTDIDHGSISGLADDDHTQYILVAGTRAFTGDQSMGSFKLTNLADGTNPADAVNYGQLVSLATPGAIYTVGAGGVSKGDLVYVSADDTVLPKDITTSDYAVGLALTTQAATETVKTTAENFVITGVLTGATAGTRYYWSGSALSATIPSASGDYVWLCGVAKNATDLDVHVEFIKKNV